MNDCDMLRHRVDYILIWGHGVQYFNEIRQMIRDNQNFQIKKIIYHKPKSIKNLVNTIYSYDYAPINHLRSKTKYLLATPKEVIFLFFENKNPNIDLLGEGTFRHEESVTLKQFKEKVRNKYNPRVAKKRTEFHVIHASDNELQTDYILKYLSFNKGVNIFQNQNKSISSPYYINTTKIIHIKKINIDLLICNIAKGNDRYDFIIQSIAINQSPHYKGLTENIDIYAQYIKKFLGGPLTEDYCPDKYIKLCENFKYLNKEYSNNYILVKRNKDKYLILDGLHRASILVSQGFKEFLVGEIIEWL